MSEFFNNATISRIAKGEGKKWYRIVSLPNFGLGDGKPLRGERFTYDFPIPKIGDVFEGERQRVTLHGRLAALAVTKPRRGNVLDIVETNVDAVVVGEYQTKDSSGRQFYSTLAYPISWVKETTAPVINEAVDNTMAEEISENAGKSKTGFVILLVAAIAVLGGIAIFGGKK